MAVNLGRAEWDAAIESFTAGWTQALLSLRLYLTHFRGERAASVSAGGRASGGKHAVWADLTTALGLPALPRPGDRIATTAAGAPPLAGTVEASEERMITLLLDEPARGVGFVGAGGPGEDVFLFVRAQLFGAGAERVAARQQEAWSAWFAGASITAGG